MENSGMKKIGLPILSSILAILFLSPLYIVFTNSFKTQKGIFLNVMSLPFGKYLRPENYTEAFMKLDFIRSFYNSLVITV